MCVVWRLREFLGVFILGRQLGFRGKRYGLTFKMECRVNEGGGPEFRDYRLTKYSCDYLPYLSIFKPFKISLKFILFHSALVGVFW